MRSMIFPTKTENNNDRGTVHSNNSILQYLVDDPKTIRYNQIIREKFSREDDDSSKMLSSRIFTNILFSECDKNKVIRYLSFLVFLESRK